ncbi:Lrp/AsnC family transcriptional regulator [Natronospora cellulosivora (SeqCode)]
MFHILDELDMKLIKDLSKDSRISYAELGRKYELSRVGIRERINNLVEKGVIEKFTIVVDHEKLGKNLSVFFDIEVKPDSLYKIANELSNEDVVINIFMMTGSPTLYVNALLKNHDELERFLKEKLYSKKDVLRANTNIMLKKFKSPDIGFCP